jgi:hypothetical protein
MRRRSSTDSRRTERPIFDPLASSASPGEMDEFCRGELTLFPSGCAAAERRELEWTDLLGMANTINARFH